MKSVTLSKRLPFWGRQFTNVLKEFYKQLAGEDIDRRIAIIND